MLEPPRALARQQRTTPATERTAVKLPGGLRVPGRRRTTGPRRQILEARRVRAVQPEPQPIPVSLPPQRRGRRGRTRHREQPTQAADMRAHKLATGARRFAAPQHVNDLLNADHPIRLGGEQAQQRALQPRRDDDRISPAPRRKGPEHIHAKFRAGIVVCGASTRLPVTVLAASRTIFPLSGVNERVELHGVHPERSGETVQRDGPRPRPRSRSRTVRSPTRARAASCA